MILPKFKKNDYSFNIISLQLVIRLLIMTNTYKYLLNSCFNQMFLVLLIVNDYMCCRSKHINCEWLNQHSRKDNSVLWSLYQGFNLCKQTLNDICLLVSSEYYLLPSLQSYQRKNKEPTLRTSWIHPCVYTLKNEENWGNLLKFKWHSPKTCREMVWEV